MNTKTVAVVLLAVLVIVVAGAIVAFNDKDKKHEISDEDNVLSLTCDIADNVKVTFGGKEYKADDKLVITDDATLKAQSLEGRKTIHFSYDYKDSYDIEHSGSGYELGTEMDVEVSFICYGKGAGTLKIWLE